VLFLKRLLLCYAVCGLRYSSEDNSAVTRSFPYPLASAFGHGGRVLLRLDGVNWRTLLGLLLQGEHSCQIDEGHMPAPFYNRRAASHGIRFDQRSSHLVETRLHNLSAIGGSHLGMNLPIGGLGNPAPAQQQRFGNLYVGPAGIPFRKAWMKKTEQQYVKGMQHGHLYLRWDEFGQASTSTLVSREDPAGSRGPASEGWRPVRRVNSMEDVDETLATQSEELLRLVMSRELAFERHEAWGLRCRGTLIYLAIELEGDGDRQLLVQLSASAAVGKARTGDLLSQSSKWSIGTIPSDQASTSVKDPRVVTFICLDNEAWSAAVERFCQGVLGFSEAAAGRVVQACHEASNDTYMFRSSDHPATICHHHAAATEEVPLVYDVLHFCARLGREDMQLLGPNLLQDTFLTEETMQLHGFGGQAPVEGTVVREWAWLSRAKAKDLAVAGLQRPHGSVGLKIALETNTLSSLLIGLESSAPLKQDFWGLTHGPDCTSKELSAFGNRKWRDYRWAGEDVPADLGGLRVSVNEDNLNQLRQVFNGLKLCKPSDGPQLSCEQSLEMNIFRRLLQDSDAEGARILKECMGIERRDPKESAFLGHRGA